MPTACSLRIWAVASASISSAARRPAGRARQTCDPFAEVRDRRQLPLRDPADCGLRVWRSSGAPSTRTMWQPTPNRGRDCARRTASSNAWPLAINVAERHDPVLVCLHDGAIHARGQTKIVGIDDQTAHRASLAGMCRVNATSSRFESSAGILPAVPRASRPRRGGRYARRHSRRDGGTRKRDPAPPGSYFFSALTFAQRAFCARRIAARPLALKGRRVLFFDAPLPL